MYESYPLYYSYSCSLRRVVPTKLRTHDPSMHTRRCSRSSAISRETETQTPPARAPVTRRAIRALGLSRARRRPSSPTERQHRSLLGRLRIADFLTLQSRRPGPSQPLSPTRHGHRLAHPLPGLLLIPCQWSHLSLTSQPRNQLPQSHACHNILNNPSLTAVLPHYHKALAIAHTTKHQSIQLGSSSMNRMWDH